MAGLRGDSVSAPRRTRVRAAVRVLRPNPSVAAFHHKLAAAHWVEGPPAKGDGFLLGPRVCDSPPPETCHPPPFLGPIVTRAMVCPRTFLCVGMRLLGKAHPGTPPKDHWQSNVVLGGAGGHDHSHINTETAGWHLAQRLISCPHTGLSVDTGQELTAIGRLGSQPQLVIDCTECGQHHYWRIEDAFLE